MKLLLNIKLPFRCIAFRLNSNERSFSGPLNHSFLSNDSWGCLKLLSCQRSRRFTSDSYGFLKWILEDPRPWLKIVKTVPVSNAPLVRCIGRIKFIGAKNCPRRPDDSPSSWLVQPPVRRLPPRAPLSRWLTLSCFSGSIERGPALGKGALIVGRKKRGKRRKRGKPGKR